MSSSRYAAEHYGPDVVLLGQWCLASDVSRSIVNSGATILEHPWADSERLEDDYTRIRAIYDRALEALAAYFGSIHDTTLSTRGWEIFIGPWLRIFVTCVFERVMLLESAMCRHGVTTLVTANEPPRRESATSSEVMIVDLHDPGWNETLCSDIARFAFPTLKREIWERLPRKTDPHAKPVRSRRSRNAGLRGFTIRMMTQLDALAQRNRRVIVHRLGMAWRAELIFMMRAGTFPHFLFPALDDGGQELDVAHRRPDLDLGSDRAARTTAALIGDYLPRIFIEDFAAAKSMIRRKYPRRPDRIITLVGYYKDDCFKLFTALALEQGAEYVILQHGGAFGTARLNDEEELQLKTADYFLTWGWTASNETVHAEVVRAPSLILSALQECEPDPLGGVILPVCEWTLHTFRLFSAPLGFRQLDYIDELVSFYRHLCEPAADLLKLRLNSGNRGWCLDERLTGAGLGRAILRTPGRFVQDLRTSRLAVVNSNSTTLLESFALNFPTVLLLRPDFWPVRPETRRDYEELSHAGILFEDPVSAARHVSEIHEDPAQWWFSAPVQRARLAFVDRFARRDKRIMTAFEQCVADAIADYQLAKESA